MMGNDASICFYNPYKNRIYIILPSMFLAPSKIGPSSSSKHQEMLPALELLNAHALCYGAEAPDEWVMAK